MTDLLLINMGMGNTRAERPYDEVIYVFEDGFEVRTALAGLALWRWLDAAGRPPRRVAFVATAKAWKERRDFALEEARKLGMDMGRLDEEALPVALPRSMGDLWSALGTLERWCTEHSGGGIPTLHLDLTHSFRAIPITQTLMLPYLENRGTLKAGILGYGVYAKEDDPDRAPMLDLARLMRLADWAAAIRDFRTRFDPAALSRLLAAEEEAPRRREIQELGALSEQRQVAGSQLRSAIEAARRVGELFPAGLPLEVGISVAEVSNRLEALDEDLIARAFSRPLAGLVSELADTLLPLSVGRLGEKRHRKEIPLDAGEIDRQIALVRRWAETGEVGNAFEAMRELLINRVLLARMEGSTGWLAEDARRPAEAALNAGRLHVGGPQPDGDPAVSAILALWNKVSLDVSRKTRSPSTTSGSSLRCEPRHGPDTQRPSIGR